MANLKKIKDVKKKKTKKNDKLAKLREVAPGIAGNDSTLKLLKRLNINPKDLTDGNYSWTKKS
jgi:hypothetical protein